MARHSRSGLAALLATVAASVCAAETVRVGSVIDGDTLVVQTSQGTQSVRLIGIDTPELHHPKRPAEYLAEQARAFVEQRVGGRRVRLARDPATDDRDGYGRLLRYVFLADGRMLNEMLVREGYAYAYTRFPFGKAERFKDLEARARAEGAGVWSAGGLDELRWLKRRGGREVRVFPMTNRGWALGYGDQVKTHVPSNQLVKQLNRLLAAMAEHQGAALRRELAAQGYVKLD